MGTLQSRLRDTLGQKYEINVPQLRRPKLKIVSISREDVSVEDSDDDVISEVVRCNNLNRTGDFHLKILKKFENRNKRMNLIVETDPKTHSLLLKQGRVKIGWSSCYVFNHVSILQCYNCLGFGHLAKDCNSNRVCSKCSGGHSYKDCQSKLLKCANCIRLKDNKNMDIGTNHSSLDRACPYLLKIISIQNKKTDYFSESL